MSLREWAFEVARGQLELRLPRRWAHVQGVARRAADLYFLSAGDQEILVAAAVLHDVGYAPALDVTGFHPLDGARFLARSGAPRRLVDLVANHSCAVIEARLRGLEEQMLEFTDECGPVRDALWRCDLMTGPDGADVNAHDRLAEIQRRYGPHSIVSRFVDEARNDLLGAVDRTEARLAAVG